MGNFLIFAHNVLCVAAIITGSVVLLDLRRRHISRPGVILFLRCSLASNIAALFFRLHDLLPSQKVAMAAVYGAGVAILAWRKFHLQGLWRGAFAFSLVIVLYLNILAISIQMFGRDGLILELASTQFRDTQLVLFAAFVMLSMAATVRFAGLPSLPSLPWTPNRMKQAGSHRRLRH